MAAKKKQAGNKLLDLEVTRFLVMLSFDDT
jgi:hypothetical protein